MVIGKIGGIRGSGDIRPIVCRVETGPAQRDVFVLHGMVVYVDTGRRCFALRQEGMQGAEVRVKGRIKSDDFPAESVVAVA